MAINDVPEFKGNIQVWARELAQYLRAKTPNKDVVNPRPVLLATKQPADKTVVDGLLMFDAEAKRPVVTIDGAWEQLVTDFGDASAIGNAVTINSRAGMVQSAALTTAALGTQIITVDNSFVQTDSRIFATLRSYAGTGIPVITQAREDPGIMTFRITNVHPTQALNQALRINFLVLP